MLILPFFPLFPAVYCHFTFLVPKLLEWFNLKDQDQVQFLIGVIWVTFNLQDLYDTHKEAKYVYIFNYNTEKKKVDTMLSPELSVYI